MYEIELFKTIESYVNDEWKELSEKLHYGLALAEQRMLEKRHSGTKL